MYPSIYLSLSLSIYLSVCLTVCLSIYLQAWKRSYSARLPQFLNLTASKTQQFSETSSIFALDNSKNEAILRDFLIFLSWQHQKWSNSARHPSKMEIWVQSWRPRTNVFCDFSSPSVQTTAPATKKWCQVIRSAALVTQNHLSKPEDQRLQNATPLRKSAPDLLTALMNMSLVLHLPRKMHLCRSSSNVPRLPSLLEMLQNLQVLITFDKEVARTCGVFNILTSKCASRHNGIHFFDTASSKSAPKLKCFVHFDFEMCFAPQRHALFRHRNFKKWSEHGVFCAFWLRNVLPATTACTFSTSQLWSQHGVLCTFWLGNVLRATMACIFSSLTWPAGSAPAALASLLFDPPEPPIIGKTQCFATFLPFRAPASSFFWLFLFSDLLSIALLFSSLTLTTSAFHLSILSEVWL